MNCRKRAAREPTHLIEDERTVVQLLEFVLKAHRSLQNLFTARKYFTQLFPLLLHHSKVERSSRCENRFENDIKEQSSAGFYTILLLTRVVFSIFGPLLCAVLRLRSGKAQRARCNGKFIPNTCLSKEKLRGEDWHEEKLRNWSYERRAHAESERRTWKLFSSFSSVLF